MQIISTGSAANVAYFSTSVAVASFALGLTGDSSFAMLKTMKVLMHICCGPCSIVPIDVLRRDGVNLTGFWFNPNIQPFVEYEKRRETLQAYAGRIELPILWRNEYQLEDFFRKIVFHEADRCRLCLHWRLETAARYAKDNNFPAFTTTLLYSKRQPHELIAEIGAALAVKIGVEFLYRDFRPGWKEGIERSKAEGMYRQQYCGCVFSERDRYLGPP